MKTLLKGRHSCNLWEELLSTKACDKHYLKLNNFVGGIAADYYGSYIPGRSFKDKHHIIKYNDNTNQHDFWCNKDKSGFGGFRGS